MGTVQAFFKKRRVSALPCPARLSDKSPMKHVWDMVELDQNEEEL